MTLLAAITFSMVDLQAQELVPFSMDSKWGYKTPDGTIVVNAIYSAVSQPSGMYGLVCDNGKWGVIASSGKEVIPPSYDYIDLCNEGIVAVYKGNVDETTGAMTKGEWGYVKLEQPEIVALEGLAFAGPFIDAVAWVDISEYSNTDRQRRTMPIVNNKGKVIGENIIFGISSSFEMRDLAVAKEDGSYPFSDGEWVLVDKDMRYITDSQFPYQMVGAFRDGLAWVKKNGKYGFVNMKGEEVIPAIYETVQDAPDAKAVSLRLNPEDGAVRWVMNDKGKIAWLNEKGETIIDFIKSDGRIGIKSVADEQMWDF